MIGDVNKTSQPERQIPNFNTVLRFILDPKEAEHLILKAFSTATMRSVKYNSYITTYAQLFARYIHLARLGHSIRLLEIGVLDGGSLQAWKTLFGPNAQIVGLDINPECSRLKSESFIIRVGDPGGPKTWKAVETEFGHFDIVIDDGSHIGFSQIKTIECYIK